MTGLLNEAAVQSSPLTVLPLWAALPDWRWMAVAGRLPAAAWAMERAGAYAMPQNSARR